MPRLTIRQHGASASIPRHPIAGNLQKPEERKANRGWTAAVARRNSQYLQRIDFERVDGTPYAVTLTLPAWQMEQVTPGDAPAHRRDDKIPAPTWNAPLPLDHRVHGTTYAAHPYERMDG